MFSRDSKTIEGLVYKVLFSVPNRFSSHSRTLTFINPNRQFHHTSLFYQFLNEYNSLMKKHQFRALNSIKEVNVIAGSNPKLPLFNHYFVLLYSYRTDETPIRKGLLIGIQKERGAFVIGVFPFMKSNMVFYTAREFDNVFSKIMMQPLEFIDVLLVS